MDILLVRTNNGRMLKINKFLWFSKVRIVIFPLLGMKQRKQCLLGIMCPFMLYGKMEIIEDENVIFDSLNEMVNKYESPDSPYKLNDVEPSFIEGMSKGIVAFKIKITKIEAKAKLSQNHPVERQELIIKHLEKTSKQDNIQVASLMRKNLV